MSVQESVAQASATAGSAVVFAGTTVIIALCGLAVAQIPFLTVMGWPRPAGWRWRSLAALTLLPALLALFGERLRPKPKSARGQAGRAKRPPGGRWAPAGWPW